MKLTFLGSGSAFTVGDNYQSNILLEKGHERLLVDCGCDARWSLNEIGLTYRDIKNVYVSHLHSDHCGGLEWLAFTTFFDPACKKPNLYISSSLVDDLWSKVLEGGLSSLPNKNANLSTYYNVIPVDGFFSWEGCNFNLFKTIHVKSALEVVPSYGLVFNDHGTHVFYTTDTQFVPEYMKEQYEKADIIFHDCETADTRSFVHAHYEELQTLDPTIKEKMWLYHYNPGPLPDAKKNGFRGFVKRGQIFDFAEKKS